MDSSLILSVAKCDVQRCIELLCDGGDPNIVTRDGAPLLHLALGVEDDEQALALAQLLFVHGAEVDCVNTVSRESALTVARNLGRDEIVSLLISNGAIMEDEEKNRKLDPTISTSFHKYIFEEKNNAIRGNKFLEEVASIFEENIKGVKDNVSQGHDTEVEKEIEITLSQFSSLGINVFPINDKSRNKTIIIETPRKTSPKQGKTESKLGVHREIDSKFGCSTPTRNHLQVPSLEMSQVSSINAHGDCSFNSTRSVMSKDNSRISLKEPNEKRSLESSTKDMFHSCISDANCEANLSFVQQYLVEDMAEGVSFYERRHSSMLGISGKVSSKNTSNVSLSSSSIVNDRTYTVSRDTNDFSKYPFAMKDSLMNISSIIKNWEILTKREMEMCEMFKNISKSAADIVNQLTRETACKASFNYLLLDPTITDNLPMKVFTESDLELWRTFVSSIFYVGKGSRSRPFQHLYEAVKSFKKDPGKKRLSEKIRYVVCPKYLQSTDLHLPQQRKKLISL